MSAVVLNFPSPVERMEQRFCALLSLDGRYSPEDFRVVSSSLMRTMTLDEAKANLAHRIERERTYLQRQLAQLERI